MPEHWVLVSHLGTLGSARIAQVGAGLLGEPQPSLLPWGRPVLGSGAPCSGALRVRASPSAGLCWPPTGLGHTSALVLHVRVDQAVPRRLELPEARVLLAPGHFGAPRGWFLGSQTQATWSLESESRG